MTDSFDTAIRAAYEFDGGEVKLGAAMHDGATLPDAVIRFPLAMLNRHGLVAGATGTGKTKTLQVMAEQLSMAGVPVFISDIKGDISGLGAASPPNEKVAARVAALELADYAPRAFPVEFFTLVRDKPGVRLRATVQSFGPILLAKVLGAKRDPAERSGPGLQVRRGQEPPAWWTSVTSAPCSIPRLRCRQGGHARVRRRGHRHGRRMIRKIVELEQQDADAFFGAPEFQVADLMRITNDGQGIINVLELADMQDRPALFSTFMMWMLAKLYESLRRSATREAQARVLLRRGASPLPRRQQDLPAADRAVARLIRSKGVGVFFVTHAPTDVPAEVLGQLGNRVQHALRAFTPEDLEVVRATSRTFPVSEFYDVERELTQLGIGEALVTGLNPKGIPMPTVRAMMRPPMSLMAQLDPALLQGVVAASALSPRYATDVDAVTAKEMLESEAKAATEAPTADTAAPTPAGSRKRSTHAPEKDEGVDWGDVVKEGARISRSGTFNTILRAIIRGLSGRR